MNVYCGGHQDDFFVDRKTSLLPEKYMKRKRFYTTQSREGGLDLDLSKVEND